jgi:CBS domain containing-hemolysin-like protein
VDLERDIWFVLLLVALVLAAMVLGAAEAALLRVPRVRVQVESDRGGRRAAVLLSLIEDLPRVINSVLLVVLLVQIAAASVTGILAERNFGNVGVTIASILLTIILFVYAEAIPKTYAVTHPLRVGLFVAPLVRALAFVLRPIVSVLVWFADLQTPGTGVTAHASLSEEELRRLVAESASAGHIDVSDMVLMERAFELGDLTVERIQVPRTDVVAVPATASVDAALDTAVRHGHRRLPVHQGTLDAITGFVRLRDLAAAVTDSPDATVESLTLPVLVVPETKRVIELLREMQQAAAYLAVSVDEHGGTSGIVTVEDVVAELVGKVADEGEVEVSPIRRTGPGRWLVAGSVDVDDLADEVGLALPHGDWHTVAGLVTGVAGRIPAPGDLVEIDDLRIEVLAATDVRVETVEVSRIGATR